jgi:hypothetical protein
MIPITRNKTASYFKLKIFATRSARSAVDAESISHALKIHSVAIAQKPARKFVFDFRSTPIVKDAMAIEYHGIKRARRCAENKMATN